MPHSRTPQRFVQDVRARWRRRTIIQGVSVAVLTLAAIAALLLGLQAAGVPPVYLKAALVPAIGVWLLVLGFVLIRPLMRTPDDRQIALYIEERLPALEDRLNSAIELSAHTLPPEHSALLDRLLDDAARQVQTVPLDTVVDRQRSRILAYGAAAAAVVLVLFGARSLGDLSLRLADGSMAPAVERPYMTVNPGSVEIEKGAAQEVVVELRDETDREVVLHVKRGEGPWEKIAMQRGLGEPAFLHELASVQEPVQYFVEHDEVRSDVYRLSLYEFPAVAGIDAHYRYPSYTGLPERTQTGSGDLRAVAGTRVTLSVAATGAVETAELVLNDTDRRPMTRTEDGRYEAELMLRERATYTIALTDDRGKGNKFPEEYLIQPVDDAPPIVTVTDPQRDLRANAIEEVFVAARAEDDFGVKALRLRFSINGGDEETVTLVPDGSRRAPEAEGDHLFFLEDYGLAPGDLISYYVEAEDHFHTEAPEASDMYFVEIIPFDQQYRQQANMGGQMGRQASGVVLSQEQIITATWNLHRERNRMEAAAYREGVDGLVEAQARLQREIEQRISGTAFSLELQMSDENRRIVEHLRTAVEEMEAAVAALEAARPEVTKLRAALRPEMRALAQLEKADALNEERQVAQGNPQSGSGGGAAQEERMTELMDLELDIDKDKYELESQRQRGPQAEQQTDDALDRVRDLARRQEQLANQTNPQQQEQEDDRRRAERLQRDQDDLRQDAESLAQQMQQLARSNDRLSRQTQEGLQRAVDQMREAERALRRGDEQEARARQQQAVNELQRLTDDLQLAGAETTREQLDAFTDGFDRFREEEGALNRAVDEAFREAQQQNGRVDRDALERLQERRAAQREALEQLRERAAAIEERTRTSEREQDQAVASDLRNLQQRLRREELAQKLDDSETALRRGWLDYADRVGDDIASAMERLETDVRELERGLPRTDEEQLRRALADVQDTLERLDELQRQAQELREAEGEANEREARAAEARMRRQAEQARETTERLARELDGNPQAQRALQQAGSLLNRYAEADRMGTLLEGDAAKQVFNDRVYAPISQLEAALAMQLDALEMEKKLYGARRADVPAAYREMVDRYFEQLSKGQ